MGEVTHPIRTLQILVYEGENDSIALIGDGSRYSYPYFRGGSKEEAKSKAEAFVFDVLEKHEKTYIARVETAEKARAARAKKK